MKDIYQRHVPLFYIAAAYNLMGAAVPLLATELHLKTFFTEQAASSGVIMEMNTQAFWVTVFFFAVGYFMVGRDPKKNRPILWIAAPGKAYVFVLWTWHYMQGNVTEMALAAGIGDIIFALLFLRFLLKTREP